MHTGAKTNFLSRNYQEFDDWKVWILWKMWLWKCELCQKWAFENVNFVNNEILKMWILSNMRLWKCDFFLMWGFENVNFVKDETLKMKCKNDKILLSILDSLLFCDDASCRGTKLQLMSVQRQLLQVNDLQRTNNFITIGWHFHTMYFGNIRVEVKFFKAILALQWPCNFVDFFHL